MPQDFLSLVSKTCDNDSKQTSFFWGPDGTIRFIDHWICFMGYISWQETRHFRKKQQLLDFPGTLTSRTSSRGPLLKRHATSAEAKDVPTVPEIELDWLKLDL